MIISSPTQEHYKFVIQIMNDTLDQVILIKSGKNPTAKSFSLRSGTCLNSFFIAADKVAVGKLNKNFLDYFEYMLEEAMYDVITHSDNVHLFSGCQHYPIKDPSGQNTSEHFYRYSNNKYTSDVIDICLLYTSPSPRD